MEIKGKFGVEIKDLHGNILKTVESSNTVVNAGIKQIRRWLDRNNCIDTGDDGGLKFGSNIVCAGEMSKVYIVDGIEITRDDESDDSPSLPMRFMFDNSEDSYSQFWESRDAWRVQSFRLKDGIDLKGIGFLRNYSSASYWHGHIVSGLGVKLTGCTISNAGTTVYNNNEYLRSRDFFNEKKYYKAEGIEAYIYVDSSHSKWIMSTSLGGSADYETTDSRLPEHPWEGTWGIVGGAVNIPVVEVGTGSYRRPYLTTGNEYINTSSTENCRQLGFWLRDHQTDDWNRSDDRWVGKWQYITRTFESIPDIYTEPDMIKPRLYGYIPDVKEFAISYKCSDSSDYTHYIRSMDFFKAVPHPQNPYALKLGVDNGTILPLDVTNTSLGNFVDGMEWKCDNVSQTDGFTVRYSRALRPDEANGIEFREIGLFMNADGHLPHKLTEPTLENADDLFARTIFDQPWTKTPDKTATIYYEITVN